MFASGDVRWFDFGHPVGSDRGGPCRLRRALKGAVPFCRVGASLVLFPALPQIGYGSDVSNVEQAEREGS